MIATLIEWETRMMLVVGKWEVLHLGNLKGGYLFWQLWTCNVAIPVSHELNMN